jgi:hypothetical protein
METRLRLVLVLGGLTPPPVQYLLCEAGGRVVARLDPAYPQARLALEYGGDDHDDTLDRERDLRTGALGWHTMRFQAADIVRSPDHTLALVRAQLDHRTALLGVEKELRAR